MYWVLPEPLKSSVFPTVGEGSWTLGGMVNGGSARILFSSRGGYPTLPSLDTQRALGCLLRCLLSDCFLSSPPGWA